MHSRCPHRTSAILLWCPAILAIGEGCVLPIPLAVYPAPDQGSGMTITFQDEDGRRIREDGLLVLHRKYDGVLPPPDSGQLLEIRDGQVVLPRKCILKLLWLGWMFGCPLAPVVGEIPTANVELYPFVSGYSADDSINDSSFEDGNVRLLGPGARDYSALTAWDRDFRKIRGFRQAPTEDYFEVVLPEQDYQRLKRHVDKEFARLRSVPTSLPTSQPP